MGPGVRAIACEELPHLATRVIVAMSDDGVTPTAEVLARAGFTAGTALHTCGARGPDALAPLHQAGVDCGVLHPLQTLASPEQGVRGLRGITFGLAGDPGAIAWGREIIALLGSRELSIDPGRMAAYHAAAVMAGNVLIAVVDAAARMMTAAGVGYQEALESIGPLCRASLDNALLLGPQAALTGPVARGDVETVRSHVAALAGAPDAVAQLYRSAGHCLLDLARRRGLPDTSLRAIAAALETGRGGDADGSQSNNRH
jgi:predicted short-subunit dehydrogenase-like oxidoreductase (DUF2520 family)